MIKKRILYVLSEIAIVIVGILLAFSIDKCAENRKDETVREQYLHSLLADLDAEKLELQENIEAFENKLTLIRQLYPYLYGKKEGRDTMARRVFELPSIVSFNGHAITYQTLINTGDIRLFRDLELIKKIENHYFQHQAIQMDYERQHNINDKYFGSFMIHHFDAQAMMKGDYSFIDNPLLTSIINSLNGTYMIAIQVSKKGIERVEDMQEIIQAELTS